MSKTKEAFLEMRERDQEMLDDNYQHQQFKDGVYHDASELSNIFKSFGEAMAVAREIEKELINQIKENESRHL